MAYWLLSGWVDPRRKEGVFWLLVQLQGSQGLDRKKGKEKENRLTHVLAASDEDSFLCGW